MDESEDRGWRGVKTSSLLGFSNRPGIVMGENLAALTVSSVPVPVASVGGEITVSTPGSGRKKEERIPQWGYHETKEFIAVRAELEKDFTQTKRNKTLWELISGKMKEKGFRRSADQCKCKWKNLVNRYKGKETSDPDNGRQCPFFDELDAIFKERAKNMDRLLLESETSGRSGKKLKKSTRLLGMKYSDDDSANEEDEEVDIEDEPVVRRKKRKADRERQRLTAEKYRANSMQEVLEDFFQQQHRLEEQWRQAVAVREQERRLREHEWREAMAKMEQERILREQEWQDREQQRRSQENARSQKRDEFFAALMAKFAEGDG
ncbi:hypothetical protein O6H91_09G083500 [Diphasiastrum complanatum]|uniref:Uncharacterized protein n=2 Tax=Diphasiastrum complanatum TaxID=34168 RepID=A0ACC2CQU9_DIPCM|nr:hypothetical protein O6H91_09G073200 [Diphasiastrum complanatum]KAJ7544573.1 hypothetical protein O6H91_09G083500 [Diphasiastrum complanatum]